MDYFGPFVSEIVGTVEKTVSYLEFRDLPLTASTRVASNLMHFDNLAGALDKNWKFDYLWSRLLDNTKKTILYFNNNPKLKEDERKMLILMAIGSSLHMVEDFYSHSDWIHFNFVNFGFPPQKNSDSSLRAPTWFEVRKKFGVPSSLANSKNWKFKLGSGIFPPVDSAPLSTLGVPLSHTTMNHDNSQLYYSGESQVKFHGFGLYPATDSLSAIKHQFYSYHTAVGAAVEWLGLLEKDPGVKNAISYAKGWDMKKANRHIADDLEDGLSSITMISCIMGKWDGSHPPPERDKDCGTFKLLRHIHIPKISNKFWEAYPKDSLLEHLSLGFGDSDGHYTFDSLWVGQHPMKRD